MILAWASPFKVNNRLKIKGKKLGQIPKGTSTPPKGCVVTYPQNAPHITHM